MCVDINEHKFEGTGKTKKDARMMAAEKAIEFLIQHPEYIQKAAPAAANTSADSIEAGSVDEKLNKVFEAPSDDEDECTEEQDADEDDDCEGGKRVKTSHDADDDESNQKVYLNKNIINNHVTSHVVVSNQGAQNERTDETIESKDNPEIRQQLFNYS